MLCLRSSLWILLIAVGLCIPAAGCGSALSREQEIEIGQEAGPQFLQEGGGPIPDTQVQQYVREVGQKLLAQVPAEERRDLPWEFHTLDSAIINAFALPGGKVFITRALLERMENEAQLAGVLGHEIGHVVAEHIGRQIRRQQGLAVVTGVIGVVTEQQWMEMLGRAGGAAIMLKYSREQELEADRLGMEYMYRARYRPGQMRKVMRILEEAGAGRGLEMLSTHPHPDSRIDQANDLLRSKYPETVRNPEYLDNAQQYQAGVLSRLQQLPPPQHKG